MSRLQRMPRLSVLGMMLVVLGLSPPSEAAEPATPRAVTQLIVKFEPPVGARAAESRGEAHAMTAERMTTLSAAAGLPLAYRRAMAGNAHVVLLSHAMSREEAALVAGQIARQADVAYAEPDAWMYPTAMPSDPLAAFQWHYKDPDADGEPGGANLPGAWNITTGSSSVVVAVVDTGSLDHTDLRDNLIGGAAAASGYDVISWVSAAGSGNAGSNDGDGRDADPTDPGNWVDASDSLCGTGLQQNSSWHGTHVAGTIGAVANNGNGGSGVAWTTRLLTVRALGVCGGLLSDIADGIAWAAGETVPGLPVNTNPAQVINLSLGGSGACGPTYQAAIDAAVARGAAVVVAAGNSNADVANFRPANCDDVITVAATDRVGGHAYYSNFDSTADNIIALAAPGGDMRLLASNGIASTKDGGATAAAGDNGYYYSQGTSMAAPHVAGVVALMLAANDRLTDGTLPPATVPALIKQKLRAAARPFPTGTGDDCSVTTCGAGIVDALAAVRAVITAPTPRAGGDAQVTPGQVMFLNGTASSDDGTIVAYAWTQTGGAATPLTNASTAVASFTAAATARTLSFQLRTTDDVGLTATDSVQVAVLPPAPAQLTATARGPTRIALDWSDNSANEAGFRVERRSVGDSAYTVIATLGANSTAYEDTAITTGTTYEYRIYAWYDTVRSAYSATAVATASAGGGGSISWPVLVLIPLLAALREKRATQFSPVKATAPGPPTLCNRVTATA